MAAADGCRRADRYERGSKDIMRFWLDAGCDGFRVDMAGSLVKMIRKARGRLLFGRTFVNFWMRNSRMQQWYQNGVSRISL